jgi:signal peptidase
MLFYVIVYFLLGLILGFTKSPYSHEIIAIFKNLWVLMIPIICIEYSRSAIANTNKSNYLVLISLTFIIFLIELNLNTFISKLDLSETCFRYISNTVVPLIATEILCTYLSLKGSYKLSLVYRLILEIIIIFSPIYPDLNWFVTGIIGVVFPTIIYVYFRYDYAKTKREGNKRSVRKLNPVQYVPIFAIIIIFVSFMLGLFKYEPIAILSNSMDPTFSRGDVVILCKVQENDFKNIEIGNIIVYSIDGVRVAHRVVDIIDDNGDLSFQTKGDNNLSVDSKLVETNQIIGIYTASIKYIGYPSVWLYDLFNERSSVVETK